ncbi:uncharacterized protein IWZ02DRAFT_163278 [Phyllosticta citriasiana]|uniref:uncharacterized protein n=1 Tax=Phyllosticta citriasiana TaxID=595635 RepID=UPI0030FD775B
MEKGGARRRKLLKTLVRRKVKVVLELRYGKQLSEPPARTLICVYLTHPSPFLLLLAIDQPAGLRMVVFLTLLIAVQFILAHSHLTLLLLLLLLLLFLPFSSV